MKYYNMILATTIQSERGKEIIKTANEFIKCDFTLNKKNIASVNLFYNSKTQEVLITFVPLNCQRYTKQGDGKALALETKTERYCAV